MKQVIINYIFFISCMNLFHIFGLKLIFMLSLCTNNQENIHFEQCHTYLTNQYNSSPFYHEQQIQKWLNLFKSMKKTINQIELITQIDILQKCIQQFQKLPLDDGSTTKLIKRIYDIIKWAYVQPIMSNNINQINNIQNIAILLGQSRAGKGTLINYLLGIQLEGKQDPDDDQEWSIQIKNKNQSLASIDHGHQSATLLPKLYENKLQNMYYMDCPGLKDTRGWLYQLISAIFIKKAILNKNISFIFIVPQDKLKQGSSRQGILNSLKALSGFVGNKFQVIKKNTILVISKSSATRHYSKWQKFITGKLKSLSQMKQLSQFEKQAILFFKQNPKKTGQFKKPKSQTIFLDQRDHLIKLLRQNFPIKIQEIQLYIMSQAYLNIQILIPHIEQNIKDIIIRFQRKIKDQFYSQIASKISNIKALSKIKQKLQSLEINIKKDIKQSVQLNQIKDTLLKISNYRYIKQIKSIKKSLNSLISDIQNNVEYLNTFSQFKSQYNNKKKNIKFSISIKNDLKGLINFLIPYINPFSYATIDDFEVLVHYWAQQINKKHNGGGISILDIEANSDWMRKIKNNQEECSTRIDGNSPFGNRKCSDFKTTTLIRNIKFLNSSEEPKKISKNIWQQVFTNKINAEQVTQISKQIEVKQILSANILSGLKRSGTKRVSVQQSQSRSVGGSAGLNLFDFLDLSVEANYQKSKSRSNQKQTALQINFEETNTSSIEQLQKWTISQTITTPALTSTSVQFKLDSYIFNIQFKSNISTVGWVAVCFNNQVSLRDDQQWSGKCWFASVCTIVIQVIEIGGYSRINNFKIDNSKQSDGTIEGGCQIIYEAKGQIKGQKGFKSSVEVRSIRQTIQNEQL